jgi:hypothetical protein
MNEENPNYYAIIPANVRYANITPNAKLLYGEITALCNKSGYCFATNNYFAELYGVSKVSISKWINELIDNFFIESEIVYKEGTKEILNRYLRIVYYPIKEKLNTPIKENLKENNTYSNNTSNNDKYMQDFEKFWALYPKQRAGSKTKAFASYCRAIREKRTTVDDLLRVCAVYAQSDEVKRGFAKGCSAWLNDDRFNVNYVKLQDSYVETIEKELVW